MAMNKLWIGWIKGYPLRDSGYVRWGHAALLHLGPLCVQWPMPGKA